MPKDQPAIGDLKFFTDRGLGSKRLPSVLRAAGWNVMTMNEMYGAKTAEGITDAKWIAEATKAGFMLLTKDLAVGRVIAESRAIRLHDARVFGLSRRGIPSHMMAATFLLHQDQICQLAQRSGPYLFALSQKECAERRLSDG
jgi:hypothetical protein